MFRLHTIPTARLNRMLHDVPLASLEFRVSQAVKNKRLGLSSIVVNGISPAVADGGGGGDRVDEAVRGSEVAAPSAASPANNRSASSTPPATAPAASATAAEGGRPLSSRSGSGSLVRLPTLREMEAEVERDSGHLFFSGAADRPELDLSTPAASTAAVATEAAAGDDRKNRKRKASVSDAGAPPRKVPKTSAEVALPVAAAAAATGRPSALSRVAAAPGPRPGPSTTETVALAPVVDPRPLRLAPRDPALPPPAPGPLHGVILVISGIPNPERTRLREMVLEMGGGYRPKWCIEATHLVCAFAGVGKAIQAQRAGGTLVNKQWVYDCFNAHARIDEAGYLMAPASGKAGPAVKGVPAPRSPVKAPPLGQASAARSTAKTSKAKSKAKFKAKSKAKSKPKSSTDKVAARAGRVIASSLGDGDVAGAEDGGEDPRDEDGGEADAASKAASADDGAAVDRLASFMRKLRDEDARALSSATTTPVSAPASPDPTLPIAAMATSAATAPASAASSPQPSSETGGSSPAEDGTPSRPRSGDSADKYVFYFPRLPVYGC